MTIELAKLHGLRVCVAVSGGEDSMALLHYLSTHAKEHAISLSVLHCDHAMRPTSQDDRTFVQNTCRTLGIPFLYFAAPIGALSSEAQARTWRHQCFAAAALSYTLKDGTTWQGFQALACAHHQTDNAETLLFRLCRGTSLLGACGIVDRELSVLVPERNTPTFPVNALSCLGGAQTFTLVHPMISVAKSDVSAYVQQHAVATVTDETNAKTDYTRNFLRHRVFPLLEQAVPGATQNLHRFTQTAQDDEEYLSRQAAALIRKRPCMGYMLAATPERVLFTRAVVQVVSGAYHKQDYTAEHVNAVFALLQAENGKCFHFLGLTATKEEGGVALYPTPQTPTAPQPFWDFVEKDQTCFGEQPLSVFTEEPQNLPQGFRVLKLKRSAIPATAELRTMQSGDKFKKFGQGTRGGGTKNLGDYFTDKKLAQSVRACIPVLADGARVLAVCGVEISNDVKVDKNDQNDILYIVGIDYQNV